MEASLVGATIQLVYPKVAKGIAEILQIPAAKWSKPLGVWEIPMTSLVETRRFCTAHNVPMSYDLESFQMPEPSRPRGGVTSDTKHLNITFPYDPQEVKKDALKKVPGVRYDKKTTGWTAPHDSLGAVIEWADKFNISVQPSLRPVAKWQELQKAMTIALSLAVDGVELEVPGITATLMDHQKVAIRYVSKHHRTFLAEDLGVGKTLEAIASLENLSLTQPVYPVLVVCPPKLGLNWKAEYERFNPCRTIQVIAKKADVLSEPRHDVTIIGHSIIHSRQKDLRGFTSFVADESHAFKSSGALRTKAAVHVANQVDGPRLLLTGTPITIRPSEYVPQLKILGLLHHFGDEHAFYTNYCDLKKGARTNYDFSGASNLEALNLKLRSIGYIRRERDDVLDLPDVMHGDVVVGLEGRFRTEYDKAEADIVEYLVNRAREIATELGLPVKAAEVLARMKAEAGQHLVRISVLRKLSALGKVEAAAEWIDSRQEEGRKVVVAAHHRDVVDVLAAKFGGLKIQGGMTTKLVEEHKAQFQKTTAPTITISMDAGSEGHTLTAAHDVLFVELPWTSTKYDQTWGRVWRHGQTKKTSVTAMLADSTLDVQQFITLDARRVRVKAATVGGEIDSSSSVVGFLLAKGLASL